MPDSTTLPALPRHQVFSPARIGAIASNTLLELVRLKVFYFLLIFALLIIGSSAFMVRLSFQEQFQMLKDVSLGSMSVFTWLLAVLATAMLLPKDIEDRTLYTILAKPVPRFEYLLGKVLGVLLLLLISTLMMSLMFAVTLYFRQQMAIAENLQGVPPGTDPKIIASVIADVKSHTFSWSLAPAIACIYTKAAIFACITLFISTYATSWIFTIMVSTVAFLIGYFESTAREYWLAGQVPSIFVKGVLLLIALVFPDLQLFNLEDDIDAGNAISMILFLKTAGLGVVYTCVYFFLAYFVFAKKEL